VPATVVRVPLFKVKRANGVILGIGDVRSILFSR
jgi:hypothetical protein